MTTEVPYRWTWSGSPDFCRFVLVRFHQRIRRVILFLPSLPPLLWYAAPKVYRGAIENMERKVYPVTVQAARRRTAPPDTTTEYERARSHLPRQWRQACGRKVTQVCLISSMFFPPLV